jgi:hypothetical protein
LLARIDCSLSRATAARSTLLPYLFDATLNFSSSPFGPELPSSLALSRLRGMFAVQSPLPSSKPKALKLPSNFRSPSGLSSFRIVALSRWLGLRNLPLSPARFPFAPRKRQSLFNNYPLTDHRSRLATVYGITAYPQFATHSTVFILYARLPRDGATHDLLRACARLLSTLASSPTETSSP